MRISDWSSDVCSSDLFPAVNLPGMTTQDSSPPARTVAAPAGQLAHATSLTRSGRFAEAGALLLPLSKAHPSDPLVHRALGELFAARRDPRSEEHTSELQSLMRISYAVFCLKKKNKP